MLTASFRDYIRALLLKHARKCWRSAISKKPVRVSTGGQFLILSPLSWERGKGVRPLFYQDFFAVHDVNALLSLVEALACDIVD